MRIACVHVPQFALQTLIRIDPSLRGAAVAVVGAGVEPAPGAPLSLALHSPIVLGCSRAAWQLGVRIGMTASAARFASPELRIATADAQLERETVRAIADALLGASPVVDCGGRAGGGAHLAMYCEVPARTRGTTFGDRLLDLLETLGLAARIGIADDRFTAWVAAVHGSGEVLTRDGSASKDGAPRPGSRGEHGVVVVPRGGSAAFLAPRPLSLLAISSEVQHMLEALGVRTLGEFAELPAPSLARPLEADYQALARGEGGGALRPYAPEAPIREELVVGRAGTLFGGAAAIAGLAERIAVRLAGRARGATRFEITVTGANGDQAVGVAGGAVASSRGELIDRIAPLIGQGAGPGTRLQLIVVGEEVAGAGDAAGEAAGEAVTALPGFARADASVLHPTLGEVGAQGRPGHGTAWQLREALALRTQGRDAHRRTRRARPPRSQASLAQPPLFANLDR